MQFSLLYRYDPAGPGPVKCDVDTWTAIAQELQAADALLHETGFFPASRAVSVTVDPDGSVTSTPGPSPGEPIAGYFTIEVASLDEAIEWAAKLPPAGKGSVEIRQVVEYEG